MLNTILQLKDLCYHVQHKDDIGYSILHNIQFSLQDGQIVALLGRSGCGKSTLLRIMAGLIIQSSGERQYTLPIQKNEFEVGMIFQNFALFPWLNVQENIELPLYNLALTKTEIQQKALDIIELIGLDGFESSMPHELSGGMKQRVGFARALVLNPKILLMDEPFSALDILTANLLKNDFLDLWYSRLASEKDQVKAQSISGIRGVVLVTHSIEEAVMMADRVLILDSDDSKHRTNRILEFAIHLAHPRDVSDVKYKEYVDLIYAQMMSSSKQSQNATAASDWSLPQVLPTQLVFVVDTIYECHNHRATLNYLTNSLYASDISEIIPLIEALHKMEFVESIQQQIALTPNGIILASDMHQRKTLLAVRMLKHFPLLGYVHDLLKSSSAERMSRRKMSRKIANLVPNAKIEENLDMLMHWGRYTGLFYANEERTYIWLDQSSE
ncbi:putative nitrate/sulfonate/bicarbonate ABC transporter ATP-binding protein [Rickettsiales endosymbiont of Paramecium tredecaurelia]|uniref:ATP-binding cassette domain-containing protein n=1 Tax=Candidatus Sarmatiella mevalonica TaxID=2770581 RepID=UPI0019207984|nr:ATP-binding cassette domain-containing protein [Candidatus Sarmatiella mevalonica]MBL3285171.1 putative nitrate/sulfonate/bicarbonate ABC transporter ATP-binding protein [Candidatus Sarmatiella mevalonica]